MSTDRIIQAIEGAAPAVTRNGANHPSTEAFVAGLVAQYGRTAVNEAIRAMKGRQQLVELLRAIR